MEVPAQGLLPQGTIAPCGGAIFSCITLPTGASRKARRPRNSIKTSSPAELLPASGATFILIMRHNMLTNHKNGEAAWKPVPD
jgi:hypothetical protein